MTPAIYSRLAAAALMGAVSANAARAENGLIGVSLKGERRTEAIVTKTTSG